ncbi:MAG: ester cyclase [Phycisphaerales bacterium JB054]
MPATTTASMKDTAMKFFDACETCQGWDVCKQYCHPDATFSAQADALADVKTLETYTEWMKGMAAPAPDGRYELLSFAVDEERNNVTGCGVFHATHTHEGGPVPPTGKAVAANYAYIMQFKGDKISHMTKIWNDGHSLRELGWA